MSTEETDQAYFWKPKNLQNITLFKAHFTNFSCEKHVHDEFSITLIDKGLTHFFFKGMNYKFTDHTIVTLNPDEIHSCGALSDFGYQYKVIYINPDFIYQMQKELFSTNQNNLFFSNFYLEDEYLYHKLNSLILLERNSLISNFEFEEEMIEVLNYILLKNCKNVHTKIFIPDSILMNKAKNYINENYKEDITLDDICNEINLSKYHFLRLFKQTFFISPHSYLMIRRVEAAKQLLQFGNSIIETSFKCGFNDQSHLSRRFKAITGITPGNYRKFFN
mgnify:CR=1 FL=1